MATTTIKQWLTSQTRRLQETEIPSARLDCLILLELVLGHTRMWILANQDVELQGHHLIKLDNLLARRLKHEPLAYITGTKEFYGRTFMVTPDVLIPRPETEIGIELLKRYLSPQSQLLDVGTGSGCIAITAFLEIPHIQVTACDISSAALLIAQKNLRLHQAKVTFLESNLFAHITQIYDVIIANLPYVDPSWATSPETTHEPSIALFEKDNGLGLIERLLDEAPVYLSHHGYLLLETDHRQHQELLSVADHRQFDHIETRGLWIALRKRPAKSH